MDDTLTSLATYGRGGKGTLVIYSAGNGSSAIAGYRVWAAHPRTMAISNSLQPDGTGAPSLNDTGGEQTFGGTSAAAPTVAAAAALMLSVEPDLTWINLRDLLRDSAEPIDTANTDPVGQWVGGSSQWYGFGRLDVDQAVRDADDFDPSVVNLLIRDSLADDGTVVLTSGIFYRSPDLWVCTADPSGNPDPDYGASPPHEKATGGADNWCACESRTPAQLPPATSTSDPT